MEKNSCIEMVIPQSAEEWFKKHLSLEVEMLSGKRKELSAERVQYKISISDIEKRQDVIDFSLQTDLSQRKN